MCVLHYALLVRTGCVRARSRVRASVRVHGSHDITQRSKANAVYRWLAFALWLGVLDAAALLTFDARRLARRRLLLGTLAALGGLLQPGSACAGFRCSARFASLRHSQAGCARCSASRLPPSSAPRSGRLSAASRFSPLVGGRQCEVSLARLVLASIARRAHARVFAQRADARRACAHDHACTPT